MTIKNTLLTTAAIAAMTIATNLLALPLLHHTSGSATNECGSEPGESICVAFKVDSTIDEKLMVDFTGIGYYNGNKEVETEQGYLGPGYYWTYEISMADVHSYRVTKLEAFFTAINGKPVNHLCHLTLSRHDLRARDITMRLGVDENGQYSCHQEG